MIVRKTTPEEAQRVNELFSVAFAQPSENGPADNQNKRIHHWGAYEDDKLLGSVLIYNSAAQIIGGILCVKVVGQDVSAVQVAGNDRGMSNHC